MSELITLTKGSPQFDAHLKGTFSKTHRALPIKSLNVNSQDETVTFQILPIHEIERPRGPLLLAQTLKLRRFILVLFPMFLVLVKNWADATLRDPWALLISTVGLIFAFTATLLRNDYSDHISGIDRIQSRSGSRAIQNGWVAAYQIRNWSWFFLVLALLCAVPLVVAYPLLSLFVGAGFVVGLYAQFSGHSTHKNQIGGEFCLFVLLGPLLTAGYQIGMGGRLDKEVLLIGCLWGWLVLYLQHLVNLVDIVASSQARISNTMTYLGFDKGRRLLAMWWTVYVIAYFFYHLFFAASYWGWYFSLLLILFTPKLILQTKAISSPIGGDLFSLLRSGRRFFLFAVFIWGFENFWYLFR